MTCKTCMTLRAKFVRWLGIALGVMEPIKEKKMEQDKMEQTTFDQNELLALVGSKEVEIAVLRKRIAMLEQMILRLTPKPATDNTVVDIKAK